MKGLELSEAYYESFGKPILESDFSDLLPYMAVGLCGSGSECYGFDDEISRDHDFEPGFCIFLPDESIISRRDAFRLERAYANLPKSMNGISRSIVSPAGGSRHGVIRINDFFRDKIGSENGDLDFVEWLHLPDYALSEATNGKLFCDFYGQITRIRNRISYYPEDIRLKKLAGNVLMMAQSGQYNYLRCTKHGETGAAQLAACEFVKSAMQSIFLLNRVYMPFYKWSFRSMRMLPKLSLLAELFEYLISTDNDATMVQDKLEVIESISSDIINELHEQKISDALCDDLEKHAYSIQDHIKNSGVRNLHILSAV